MRTELDESDITLIADRIVDRIKPLLGNNRVVDDVILNVAEAAALLRVSKLQIYAWVNKSQYGLSDFPVMRAGRLLRFSKNDLIAWLKNKKSG